MLNNLRVGIAQIPKSLYIKNIITLARGTLLAQIIGFIASPILTRIYSPEELGVFALVTTLVNLLAPVACGKYELGIVTAKDNEEENALVKGSLIIMGLITIAISITMVLLYIFRIDIFGDLGAFYFFVIPNIVLLAFINLMNSVNNRREQYKVITQLQIARTTVLSIIQIVSGFAGAGIFGLLGGQVISNLAGIFRQIKSTKLDYRSVIEIKSTKVKIALKKYIRHPLYSVPSVFINTCSYSAVNFCISALYSSTELGYYSMAYRVISLPIELIAQNISRVYFQKASEEHRLTNNCKLTYKSTTIAVLSLGSLVGIIGWFISEQLFEFVFGQGWGKAGLFVKYMIPLMVIRVVVVATGATLIIFRRQHIDLLIQCALLLSTVIMYVIADSTKMQSNLFIIYLSSVQLFVYVCSMLYSYRLISANR